MLKTLASPQSAPECQLSRPGTAETFALLLKAARKLPGDTLSSFEEEIDFYAKTGLIGVQMSKMLTLLDESSPEVAA